ncbi:bis-aminopropyl spermidine synthase family protein [Paenibacillus flagellatus]|uniref:Putative methyltransferase n=1 Tax=Paenibacillus flagellatus TaxID=2211139 RepID=A0A2V5JW55_9BACL|nr:bis-aminopropyl spermidine synthase family protein [Paenibacillus flagellatus]PYI50771.1 putative methyltransferase [Paenibacillus flagellatus]
MDSYIKRVSERIELQEGRVAIEQLLLECYLHPGVSTKELARSVLLPVPVAAAVKRELIKAGALVQDRGVRCTAEASARLETEWGLGGLDRSLYQALIREGERAAEWKGMLAQAEALLASRPPADVRIDQSMCTPETSLRRAVLGLKQHALIGKRILCVGDDDLVSVSMGVLLGRLFPGADHSATRIHVLDKDERFLRLIGEIAAEHRMPIECHRIDLREPLPDSLLGRFDCIFTDPPYTLQGMSLFVSRGISALKREKGLPIFLSFAHKSPAFNLAMQRELVRMGLTVGAGYPNFNAYEGAEMIANRSQMFILRTTDQTEPEHRGVFADALYTGEVKQTRRTYRCKRCARNVTVGLRETIAAIEQLKNEGCSFCGNDTFELVSKQAIEPACDDAER